jgi:transposase
LKVKEVTHNGTRYIVCINDHQARKDAAGRQATISTLKQQLKKVLKHWWVIKAIASKYLKVQKGSAQIYRAKIKDESRFDGKWVLTTNTNLVLEQVALKYKGLWRVERVFRDVKSPLETRPVYYQNGGNIAGHVFSSFLDLVLRKELNRCLFKDKHRFEWNDIKQDLKALKQVEIEQDGQLFGIRSECKGVCGKIFQSVHVALPPTIKVLN